MTTYYKTHYEPEPGKPICGNRATRRITIDKKKVTCGVCKRMLQSQQEFQVPPYANRA